MFSFSSCSPYPGVFAWWCGAGPELDHLYQFVSDYSHQVIVQLTHQKYIWQLRQIHLTINRNTFDNYDKYIWQFGQIALTICTTLSLIIATKSLCRSSSSATNKRQSKTDCLALITSTREGLFQMNFSGHGNIYYQPFNAMFQTGVKKK